MEIKDLMIGDLVLINGTPRKIQGIDSLDGEVIADGEIYTLINDRCHSEDNVSGIPLTHKILEKNGFKFNNLPFVLGWEQFGLTLCPEGAVPGGQGKKGIIQYLPPPGRLCMQRSGVMCKECRV